MFLSGLIPGTVNGSMFPEAAVLFSAVPYVPMMLMTQKDREAHKSSLCSPEDYGSVLHRAVCYQAHWT